MPIRVSESITSRLSADRSCLEAAIYLKALHGSSRSALIQASDRKLYVVKLAPNPLGPNVLANEALGFHLMQGLGLSVPSCSTVLLSQRFIDRSPQLLRHFGGGLQAFAGRYFASQFIEGSDPHARDLNNRPDPRALSNRADFLGVYVFDVWANHQDRRDWLPKRCAPTGACSATFFDNSHLFGGPNWEDTSGRAYSHYSELIQSLSREGTALQAWIARLRNEVPKLLHQAIEATPALWFKANIRVLETSYLDRLLRLAEIVTADLTRQRKLPTLKGLEAQAVR